MEEIKEEKNANGFRHVEDRKVTKMPLRVTNQWAYHSQVGTYVSSVGA